MADEEEDLPTYLQFLKSAMEELQSKPIYAYLNLNSPAIKAFLKLEAKSSTILSLHSSLSEILPILRSLIDSLDNFQSYGVNSFVRRRLIWYQIKRVSKLVLKEVQSWFDREMIRNLVEIFDDLSVDDEKKIRVLEKFESRISLGFDLELQDLILRKNVFGVLEFIVCDESCTLSVRENAAMGILGLGRFNKDVFVSQILMGFAVKALILMGSCKSLLVLANLVRLIKGHLLDKIELNGEIPMIISSLSSEKFEIRVAAMECLFEMAYFGRKEVVWMMIECGLVEKLVLLQRTGIGTSFNGVDHRDNESENTSDFEERKSSGNEVGFVDRGSVNDQSFVGYIARFAVKVEVGEGMGKKEKKEIKMEILRRAREACVSEAEAATVVAEILWGSHP